MLGFSPEDVARASIYDGEKDFTATSGPIWVRFTNGTIPSNAVAQRCNGNEGSINECNVSMISNWFSKLKYFSGKMPIYAYSLSIVFKLSRT